jgi:hypothetical protein
MAARSKKTSGIRMYNLLMKEVSAINRHLPEDRRLSVQERYKLISEKLYPKYKGQAVSKVRKLELRDKVYKTIKRLPKRTGCNVLAIPEEAYQEIPYFEIDDYLAGSDDQNQDFKGVLPKCVFVMINAGEQFGKTTIFNTRDYDYHRSGVNEITNNINNYIRTLPERARRGLYPMYSGVIQLRPGKANDGSPDSYYIEMILEVRGKSAEEKDHIKVPKTKKTKTQLKGEKSIRKYVEKQIRNLQQEKSKIKRLRKSVTNNIYEGHKLIERMKKFKGAPKDFEKSFNKSEYKREKARIEKYYKNNIISTHQYESLLKQIKKGYKH